MTPGRQHNIQKQLRHHRNIYIYVYTNVNIGTICMCMCWPIEYHNVLVVKMVTIIYTSISKSASCSAYFKITCTSAKSSTVTRILVVYIQHELSSTDPDPAVKVYLQLDDSVQKLFTQVAEGLQQPFVPIVELHPKSTPLR